MSNNLPYCLFNNKISFYSRKFAKKHARRITGKLGKKFRVYLCEVCKYFHLTTTSNGQPWRSKINYGKGHPSI
jgi:hypothetical protein